MLLKDRQTDRKHNLFGNYYILGNNSIKIEMRKQ